ncbi:MAG: DUF3806 domain-containing protein [Planctomycetota bacterium]
MSQPDTLFLKLSGGEADRLEAWIERAAALAEQPRDSDPRGWLSALGTAANSGALRPDDVNGIGAAFGEVLAHDAGLVWTMVLDSWGGQESVAFGLRYPGTTLVCFPLDMIHKRAGRERLNLAQLLAGTVTGVRGAQRQVGPPQQEPPWEQCVYGLDSIDLTARRPDGAVLVVLVTVGRMTDDARIRRLLAYKLRTYEGYISGRTGTFAPDYGNPPAIIVRVSCAEPPAPTIEQWLRREGDRLHAADPRITLEVTIGPA